MRYKKHLILVFLFLFPFMAAIAMAQTDPKDQAPTEIFEAQTSGATSAPYAVITSATGETIWFSFAKTTVTAITGSYTIEGTIDSEAKVKAGTAVWKTWITDTVFPAMPWITDPPAYIRVTVTPTAGSFRVIVRGPGTQFRKVI